MTDITLDTIRLLEAEEALRQQRESFNEIKRQARAWHRLQIAIGWVTVVMIPAITTIAAIIILNHNSFTSAQVTAATGALFLNVLGLAASAWRFLLSRSVVPQIQPITKIDESFPRAHKRNAGQVPALPVEGLAHRLNDLLPDVESLSEREPDVERDPPSGLEPVSVPQPDLEPVSVPQPDLEPVFAPQPDLEPEPVSAPQPDLEPEPVSAPQPDLGREPQPEAEAEPQPRSKMRREANPKSKADQKPLARSTKSKLPTKAKRGS